MGGIGGPELFLVLVVVLLVFGPKKIPEVARGIGKGMREFRKLSTDFQREINLSEALEEEEKRIKGRPGSGRPGAGATPGTATPPAPDAAASAGAEESPGTAPRGPVESSDSRKSGDE